MRQLCLRALCLLALCLPPRCAGRFLTLGGEMTQWESAKYGNLPDLKAALIAGDVNAADPWTHMTCLMLAAKTIPPHEDIVRYLLDEAHASTAATDRSGHTALWWALRVGNTKIALILREHGAQTWDEGHMKLRRWFRHE